MYSIIIVNPDSNIAMTTFKENPHTSSLGFSINKMANYFSCLRFVGSWFCNWPGPAQIPTHNRDLPAVKLDTTHMGNVIPIMYT